jgi:hypothetical protein
MYTLLKHDGNGTMRTGVAAGCVDSGNNTKRTASWLVGINVWGRVKLDAHTFQVKAQWQQHDSESDEEG